MKTIIPALFIFCLLMSCGNSGNESSDGSNKQQSSAPGKVIKTTKQFITNEDGTVTENTVDAEIQFFAEKIAFVFASDASKNFEIVVTGMEDSPEGVNYMVKDKKYTDVFVAAGAEPQINLNALYGSITFM
jgi:hypothetical protein